MSFPPYKKSRESRNTHANSLATPVTAYGQDLSQVILIEDLHTHVEDKKEKVQVHQIMVRPSWMDPLVLFLKEGVLPNEKREAEKIRRKASQFWLSEEQKLYQHSFSGP